VRVVGLGAICDLGPHALDDPRQNSFDVREFALLDNGERVTLHAERGWSGRRFPSGSVWAGETVEKITETVLAVVLPDSENGDEHPWEWLAELAQAQGIDVTAAQLRQVPYEVVLTERVLQQLGDGVA
jgi:hypothetical protein